MRRVMMVWGVLLAALGGGCTGPGGPSGETVGPEALGRGEVRVSLELAKQDKDGLPGTVRVVFENTSGRQGNLTLPLPLPGQAELEPPLPPTIVLLVRTQDSHAINFTYADVGAKEVGRSRQLSLGPGEKCVREYRASEFYAWSRVGPDPEKSLAGSMGPGPSEVRVQAAYVIGSVEDRPEEPVTVDSEPVVMHCSLAERLFEKEETPPEGTALHLAVSDGDVRSVERLLAQGADLEAKSAYERTPLHVAAEKGNAKIVEILLANGAKIDARDNVGNSALTLATLEGHVDVMNILISKGADLEARAMGGNTPLHLAAKEDQFEAVKILLAAGADPNAKGDLGDTPLHMAASRGRDQLAALLLDKGADVSAPGNSGWTPLHYAAMGGYKSTVALLIAHGADVNAKSKAGDTPLAIAAQCGRKATVKLLKEHGATE